MVLDPTRQVWNHRVVFLFFFLWGLPLVHDFLMESASTCYQKAKTKAAIIKSLWLSQAPPLSFPHTRARARTHIYIYIYMKEIYNHVAQIALLSSFINKIIYNREIVSVKNIIFTLGYFFFPFVMFLIIFLFFNLNV